MGEEDVESVRMRTVPPEVMVVLIPATRLTVAAAAAVGELVMSGSCRRVVVVLGATIAAEELSPPAGPETTIL